MVHISPILQSKAGQDGNGSSAWPPASHTPREILALIAASDFGRDF